MEYAILAIVTPLLITFIWNVFNKAELKIILCRIMAAEIIANSVMMVSYYFFKERLTAYEFIAINAVSVIFLLTVLFDVYKQNFSAKTVLNFTCFSGMITILHFVMTYGQTAITSDVATSILLARSQLENHSMFPKTWCSANGELWVLGTNLVSIFTTSIFNDQSFARMVTSCIVILIAIVGVIYLHKALFNDKSFLLTIPLVFLFLRGRLNVMLIEVAYTSILFFACILATLSYRYYLNNKKVSGALLCLVLFLLSIGGARTFAEYTLPLLICVFLFSYCENDKQINKTLSRRSMKTLLAIVLPSLFGYVIHTLLVKQRIVNSGEKDGLVFSESIDGIFRNIGISFVNLYNNFGYTPRANVISLNGVGNLVTIVACTVVCIIIPVLQIVKIKEESDSVKWFVIYGLVHNVILGLTIVLCDKTDPHYILSIMMVCIIVSSRYIWSHWLASNKWSCWPCVLSFVFACLIEGLILTSMSVGWNGTLEQQKQVAIILEHHNLKKGYATYWNAYNNSIYSNLELCMGSVYFGENNIIAHRWLVDDKVYTPINDRTFLLLDGVEAQSVENIIEEECGVPIEVFEVAPYKVYVFDHDIAGDIIY